MNICRNGDFVSLPVRVGWGAIGGGMNVRGDAIYRVSTRVG